MSEFNIALNTIVYLMIFLFPGIIFRKFLYIREYSKEFDKGNLFERFIITLIMSIMMLCLTSTTFILLNRGLKIDLISSISYDTIRNVFEELSDNNLPDINKPVFNQSKFSEIDLVRDFGVLLLFIYSISGIFGFLCYIIISSNIIKRSGFFKFLNYWQDIIKGRFNTIDNDTLAYGRTDADVLVDCGDKSILYSGTVVNYYLDNQTNKLQTLILCEAKRYVQDENGRHIVKTIPGHNFVVESDKIINLNFTYVYESKRNLRTYKVINAISNIIFTLIFLFLMAFVFTQYSNQYINSIFKKIVFLVVSSVLLFTINYYIKCIFTKQFSLLKIKDIYFNLFFIVPLLWVFNIVSFYVMLLIAFSILVIISSLFSKKVSDEREIEQNRINH